LNLMSRMPLQGIETNKLKKDQQQKSKGEYGDRSACHCAHVLKALL